MLSTELSEDPTAYTGCLRPAPVIGKELHMLRSPLQLAAGAFFRHELLMIDWLSSALTTVWPYSFAAVPDTCGLPRQNMAAGVAGRAGSPADESTPLLPPKSPTLAQDGEDKPLRKDQLFLLCLARLVEPVAFFSIFPFLNEMIEEVSLIHAGGSLSCCTPYLAFAGSLSQLGVPTEHCGFYTGAVESLFSFVQFLIMPIWGRYSDKVR